MARPANPDFIRPWKVALPATLAGRIEYVLLDPVLGKPLYASRNKLLTALLEWWLAREEGKPDTVHVPSITELRTR